MNMPNTKKTIVKLLPVRSLIVQEMLHELCLIPLTFKKACENLNQQCADSKYYISPSVTFNAVLRLIKLGKLKSLVPLLKHDHYVDVEDYVFMTSLRKHHNQLLSSI